MKKYTITGGDGFIGSKITRAVNGYSFDIKSDNDIFDEKSVTESFKNSGGVFHCAAKISVPESIKVPKEYFHTNVDGTKCIIACAEEFALKIVFSSSAAVYGDSDKDVKETQTLRPKSPYAENKIDAERLLEQSKIPHIALRYFNVYGPGQSPQYAGVITSFILNALKGSSLVIYGDGKQVRDFIFVDDVVNANIQAMNYANKKFDVFNIASGVKITINELAEIIIRLTKSPSKIQYESSRAGDIVYSAADISKAKNILGWNPECSLESGLIQTIDYYRKQLSLT